MAETKNATVAIKTAHLMIGVGGGALVVGLLILAIATGSIASAQFGGPPSPAAMSWYPLGDLLKQIGAPLFALGLLAKALTHALLATRASEPASSFDERDADDDSEPFVAITPAASTHPLTAYRGNPSNLS